MGATLICITAIAAVGVAATMPPVVRFVSVGFTSSTGATHLAADVASVYTNNEPRASFARDAVEGRDFVAGIDAAFMEANDAGGIHGTPVQRFHVELSMGDYSTPAAVETALAAQLDANPNPGTIALGASAIAFGNTANSVAGARGLAGFGNVDTTMAAQSLTTHKHAIAVRLPLGVESHLLTQYAVQSNLRCKRTAIFYTAAESVDGSLAEQLRATLESIGYATPAPVPVTLPSGGSRAMADAAGFAANVTEALRLGNTLQQAQCIAALFDTSRLSLFLGFMADIPTFNISEYALLTPSAVQSADWRTVDGFSQGWYDRLYATSHVPDPFDERYAVAANFRASVQRLFSAGYPRSTVASVGGNAAAAARWRASFVGLEGYVTGRLFLDACRATSSANFTAANVIEAVYRQKLFAIDDFTLGPYSSACPAGTSRAAELPYPCECNAGSRRLFVTRVNTTLGVTQRLEDDAATFQVGIAEAAIPLKACTPAEVAAQTPISIPLIHASVAGVSLSPELQRVRDVTVASLATWVTVARLFGFARDSDVDMIAIELPQAANITDALARRLPARAQLQGYAALALDPADLEAVKSVDFGDVMNIAPLRYQYALLDDPLPANFADWNSHRVPLFPVIADFINAAAKHVFATRGASGIARTHIVADTTDGVARAVRALEHYQTAPGGRQTSLFASTAEAAETATPSTAILTAFDAAIAAVASGDQLILATQNGPLLQRLLLLPQHQTTLGSNGTVVIIAASEFVVYDVLVAAMTAAGAAATTTVPSSLVYASGVATWGETEPQLVLLDPADAYAAVIASLVYSASGSIFSAVPTPSDFGLALYTSSDYGPLLGRVYVGPFVNASCAGAINGAASAPASAADAAYEHPGGDCQCNKGITRFHVRSLDNWFQALRALRIDGDVAGAARLASTVPITTIIYDGCAFPLSPLADAPAAAFLSTTEGQIAVGGGSPLLVILLVIIGWRIGQRGKRDNSCAPKDATQPFAMVFTDIQSSTTMWARAPQHMGPAVDAHHELIRALIPAHRGYEVKTIGDSFMVAFKSAQDAVDFACELQSTFFDHAWGTEVFDETYKELIADSEERRLADADAASSKMATSAASAALRKTSPLYNNGCAAPTTQGGQAENGSPTSSAAAAYEIGVVHDEARQDWYDRAVWNGLRVRVGVHFGTGDIKLDPVSQGYDYYGTVVNTAARVEGVAHGGQIAVTAAVVAAVTDGGERTLASLGLAAVDFGPQPLRGLDDPIGLAQVLPARFAARTYPPLRLDVEQTVEEEADDGDEGSEFNEDGLHGNTAEMQLASTARRRSSSANQQQQQSPLRVGPGDDGVGGGMGLVRSNSGTTSASGGGGAGRTSVDDLAHFLSRRVRDASERNATAANAARTRLAIETMFATSAPEFRTATISHLADKWRVSQLRIQPGMRRFVRRLGEGEVDLALLAYRISTATDVRQASEDFGGDALTRKQSTTYTDAVSGDFTATTSPHVAGPMGAAKHRRRSTVTTFVVPPRAQRDAAAPDEDGALEDV